MFLVEFTPLRVVEHQGAQRFWQVVEPMLVVREAENCVLIGLIQDVLRGSAAGNWRLLSIEERDRPGAAALVSSTGMLVLTWATPEMLERLIDFLQAARQPVTSIYAPAYTSWQFSRRWAEATQQDFTFDREERVYQLSRVRYELPATGRLEAATSADQPLLVRWLERFVYEVRYECATDVAQLAGLLIQARAAFLWKAPDPVAMASWSLTSTHGASMNFVYTPPEFRGRGYGKAVSAALGGHMLASGRRYCFILTDREDMRTNALYQKIGARTVCEMQRCLIVPRPAAQSPGAAVAVSAK